MRITTITFPQTFGISSKKVELVSAHTSIEQCLSLLLTSAKGELLGDPDYGTHLLEYIYNYTDNVLFELIRSDIVDAVRMYEPRIYLETSDIDIIDDNTTVKITLNYYMRDEGEFNSFTLAVEREESAYGY